MLPQLRKLEQSFPEGLAVIGVHSGKFIAERKTERIRAAVERLRVDHPVVNDRQFRVWRAYAVNAWPTLTLIDASGYVVAQQAGEIPADALIPVVERLLVDAAAAGTLDRAGGSRWQPAGAGRELPPPFSPEAPSSPQPREALRFPAGLAIDLDTRRLFIADTGRDRIIAVRLDDRGLAGSIDWVSGGGAPGFRDGDRDDARFDQPRGLAYATGRLHVADAGNHAIRVIDAASGRVATAAGTGEQSRTWRATRAIGEVTGATDARETALNSPWDLEVTEEAIFIAMAGSHQIWRLDRRSGRIAPWTGSGAEALEDGPPELAALAQPSGLALIGQRLFFADSESSAIRWADIADGRVHTLVGTGLFDFGDRDGVADHVRLQHAQAIAADDRDLYIADTYNDRIKKLDVESSRVTTWLDGSTLFEPSALALTPTHLYIADTNHHRIMIADRRTSALSPLVIR